MPKHPKMNERMNQKKMKIIEHIIHWIFIVKFHNLISKNNLLYFKVFELYQNWYQNSVAGLHLGWWNEIHISVSNTNDTSTVLAKPKPTKRDETRLRSVSKTLTRWPVDIRWPHVPWKGDMSPNCPGPDDPDFPSLGSLKKNWMEKIHFQLSTLKSSELLFFSFCI